MGTVSVQRRLVQHHSCSYYHKHEGPRPLRPCRRGVCRPRPLVLQRQPRHPHHLHRRQQLRTAPDVLCWCPHHLHCRCSPHLLCRVCPCCCPCCSAQDHCSDQRLQPHHLLNNLYLNT